MRLLLWGTALVGGYCLLQKAEKKKAEVQAAVEPLSNYISTGACCSNCSRGMKRCG